MLGDVGTQLALSPECQQVLNHRLFPRVAEDGLSLEAAERFVGQFWHPSHYFPTFLAGLIAVAPSLEVKTSLSRILWQELGEGDPRRAHESIYVDTMLALGLRNPAVPEDPPNEATTRLVELYAAARHDYLDGLGCIFATEAIDLPIVSALGAAVSAATGTSEIPWVAIHAEQEPDHIESASDAVAVELLPAEREQVTRAAVRMWQAWDAFYSALEEDIFASVAEPA